MISFVLAIGLVTALEVKKTEFVIKTEPYQNLSISVIDPDTDEEVELFEGRARKFGEYRFTYYGTIDKVLLKVSIIDNETGKKLKNDKFGPYDLGSSEVPIDFYLLSVDDSESGTEEESIDDLNASTETDDVSQQKGKIQGLIIGQNLNFSKTYYFVGAGVLGVLILAFVLRKHLIFVKPASPVEPHPSKVVKSKSEKPEKVEVKPQTVTNKSNDNVSINETEKRIADLQKQLDEIRGEEKLLKLQEQLKRERQSLKKMQEDLADEPPKLQNSNSGDFNFENKKPDTI